MFYSRCITNFKHIPQNKTFNLKTFRPDSVSSFDWFGERQMKVLRYIREFLKSNKTNGEPEAIEKTRIMFQACMNTSESILTKSNSFIHIEFKGI